MAAGLVATSLRGILQPQAAAPGALDDYWYGPVGTKSAAGVVVNDDTAYTLSAFWRGIHVVAGGLGMLPLHLYEFITEERRRRATSHPLYRKLHDNPNPRQTALEWKTMMQSWLMVRGDAYSLILPGADGGLDFWPQNPNRVQIDEVGNHRLVYTVIARDGTTERFPQEMMFHLRGLGGDGIHGMSLIGHARESLGLGIAGRKWGAAHYGNGISPSGVLQHPGELGDVAEKRIRDSWGSTYGGPANAGKFMILEEGMTWQRMEAMTPQDAEWIASQKFSVEDVSRWTGVPPHLLMMTGAVSNWGTGIEQQNVGFLLHTMLYWLELWQQGVDKDLLADSDRYYSEFDTNAYMRGDTKSRFEAYSIALGSRGPAWMTPNQVRLKENMEPEEALDYYALPANMRQIRPGDPVLRIAPPAAAPPPPPEPVPNNGAALVQARVGLLLRDAASRVARKETVVVQKIAARCGDDRSLWEREARAFYTEHIDYVRDQLKLSIEAAGEYCQAQLEQVLFYGASVLELSQPARVVHLVSIAAAGAVGGEGADEPVE